MKLDKASIKAVASQVATNMADDNSSLLSDSGSSDEEVPMKKSKKVKLTTNCNNPALKHKGSKKN